MPSLDRITIQGFKSIRSLENFELRQLNVLVGANGAGKSNFLEFFALLRAMCGFSLPFLPVSGLANYSAVHGGCERILHNGSRTTSSLTASLEIEGPPSPSNFCLQWMMNSSLRGTTAHCFTMAPGHMADALDNVLSKSSVTRTCATGKASCTGP